MLADIAKQCRTIEECRTELHNENPQISQTLTLRLRKSSPLREHDVATGRALQQLVHAGRCDTPAHGLIGLIGYSYQQVATSFPEAGLQRTPRLSVIGPEKFGDG